MSSSRGARRVGLAPSAAAMGSASPTGSRPRWPPSSSAPPAHLVRAKVDTIRLAAAQLLLIGVPGNGGWVNCCSVRPEPTPAVMTTSRNRGKRFLAARSTSAFRVWVLAGSVALRRRAVLAMPLGANKGLSWTFDNHDKPATHGPAARLLASARPAWVGRSLNATAPATGLRNLL